jgi:hypothetical protein
MTINLNQQELVYEHYGVDLYKRVNSPLRDDNEPSFSTKILGDRIVWSDFGLGLLGKSVYDFVMEMEGVEFKDAAAIIRKILEDNVVNERVTTKRKPPKEKVLKVVPNDKWAPFESYYWGKREITPIECERNLIYPLKMLFIDGRFICTSTKENPKFIYYFDEDDRRGFKVYSPLDKEHKWLSYNTSFYSFENKVSKVFDDLIIFSSRKDRMVFDSLGLAYATTSVMAEGNFSGLLKELPNLTEYKNIYSFFDFEFNEAGEKMANKLYEQSSGRVVPISPPQNILNYLISAEVKDIDDLLVKEGREYLNKTIRVCLRELGEVKT